MVSGETFSEVYSKLLDNVIHDGEIVKPRGKETKELLSETFKIEYPEASLIYIPGRSFNLMHAFVESFLLTSDDDTLEVASSINETICNFSDDGYSLHGAYGKRICKYINFIIDKLKKDKDSRQAVINIYDRSDLMYNTKDVPCTMSLQFMIRRDKLDMFVYMRSNDIVWGIPYDVFQFTNLQCLVANSLEIPVGNYYHTDTSLHIYSDHYELAESILGNTNAWKSICNEQPLNVQEWRAEGKKYIDLVKSGYNTKLAARCFESGSEHLKALIIEHLFRGNIEVDFYNYIDPAFVRNVSNSSMLADFTKRWNKNVRFAQT